MTGAEKLLKKAGMFILGIFLVIYVSKQLINLVDFSLQVEPALAVTASDKLFADCYVMRDETVLRTSFSGIMLACVQDGGRISKDRAAVSIYSSENDFDAENQIRQIDEKISVLEKSSIDTGFVSADLTKMDEEIGELLDSAAVFTSDNDFVGALSKRDSILIEMNKRWLISNPAKSFDDKIAELSASKNALKNRLSASANVIYAPQSGYYFGSVDGYENIFSSKKISTLTLDEFSAMMASEPESFSENSAGKIVTDYVWYIACPVTAEEASRFNVGNTYAVEFAYSYGTVLDMPLVSKITEDGRDDAILVFSSGNMPEGFEYARKQKVSVVYKHYSGLKIPKDAVRIVDDKKGVYVLKGTTVEFRLMNEIYTLEDFYIADSNAENYPLYEKSREYITENDEKGNETTREKITYYQPVSLYDLVIVDADEIYDGMKIEG